MTDDVGEADDDGKPNEGVPVIDPREDAKRRFRDVVRIHMADRRILTDADEAALLELALGPLELSLATARGILLHQALDNGVLLESREDRRLMELISALARDGVLDRRGVHEVMVMAGPPARALGREGRLRAHVSDLAEAVGVRAKCGITAPGPRGWNVALPEYVGGDDDAQPPAWWAVR